VEVDLPRTDAPDPPRMAADRAAFAVWAGPALPPMTRLARRLAPPADADYIVQDALTRAWQKRHLYDESRGTASAVSARGRQHVRNRTDTDVRSDLQLQTFVSVRRKVAQGTG
jgi:hypothetical protein